MWLVYVTNLAIICSGNGLSPSRCQAIVWTNAGILLIGLLRNVCIMLTHWALGDAALILKKYDFQTHYTE